MSTPMLNTTQIEAYLRHLRDDRRLAASTLRGYREELFLLLRRGVALDGPELAAHVTGRADAPLAPNTRNRRLAIVRGLCRYLVAAGELSVDPTLGIRRARVQQSRRAALGVTDLQRVLDALHRAPSGVTTDRDETILLLLFYTGLRISELLRLELDQVDIAGECLRAATRKGGGATDVVLHPTALRALVHWLLVRPSRSDGRALFPGGHTTKHISARSAQKRLRELGEQAGLSASLHPHALRHAHATALLRVGVATELIRQSLNHRSLQTTARYLHGDDALLRGAINRLPDLVSPVK